MKSSWLKAMFAFVALGIFILASRTSATAQTKLSRSQALGVLASELVIKTKVATLPAGVKESFSDYFGEPFFMADPGEAMNGCVVERGVPNQRLVFAAVSEDAAVILFEVGGYSVSLQVAVFDLKQKRVLAATLTDPSIRDIASLRASIAEGHYRELAPPPKFHPKLSAR